MAVLIFLILSFLSAGLAAEVPVLGSQVPVLGEKEEEKKDEKNNRKRWNK